MVADVEIILALVSADLLSIPDLEFIRTEKFAKRDDVEDDDSVEQENQQHEHELFSPGHANVWSLHTANPLQEWRWNEACYSPY